MLQKNLRLAVGKPCYMSYIFLCRIMDYTKCNSVLNNVFSYLESISNASLQAFKRQSRNLLFFRNKTTKAHDFINPAEY